jgi:hypothetical protein
MAGLGTDFDQLYELPKVQLSAQKLEKEEELRNKLRQIFIILNRAFKLKAGNTGLRIDAVSNYNQDTIYHVAKMVVSIMTTNLSLLSAYSIDQTYIDELNALAETYSGIKTERDAAIKLRDIATRQRVQNAANVYEDLVFFAQMGKAIFTGMDTARYNDYVLASGSTNVAEVSAEDLLNEETPPDTVESVDNTEMVTEPAALNS